jgi:hypothetical protein
MRKYTCNVCGETYLVSDPNNPPVSMQFIFPYGSDQDGDEFQIDVCPYCLKPYVKHVDKICVISPIINK